MSLFSEREKKCGTQQRQQQTNNHTFGGLENFLRHTLEWQIIRILQIHKEENENIYIYVVSEICRLKIIVRIASDQLLLA